MINIQRSLCRERRTPEVEKKQGGKEGQKDVTQQSYINFMCIKTEENQAIKENYLFETPRIIIQYQQPPHILFFLLTIFNVEEVFENVSRT